MENDEILKLLLRKELDVSPGASFDIDARIKDLKSLNESYKHVFEFKIGDIVHWKKGLKNKKVPAYGEPAVVIQNLVQPILDDKEDTSSPYFREPLNIKLGVIRNGDLLIFHFDSHRFELLQR